MSNRTTAQETRNLTSDKSDPGPRILIVDDDAVLSGLHEAVLSLAGYGTESVCNGEEALVMLALADFDLVLTDRNMPVLDGVELVRKLRAGGSRIPVMMVSGSLANGDELPADIRDEVAVALPKPSRLSELLFGIALSLRWVPKAQKITGPGDTLQTTEASPGKTHISDTFTVAA